MRLASLVRLVSLWPYAGICCVSVRVLSLLHFAFRDEQSYCTEDVQQKVGLLPFVRFAFVVQMPTGVVFVRDFLVELRFSANYNRIVQKRLRRTCVDVICW